MNQRNRRYGYVRVSTKEQNEDRQLLAMQQVGIPAACLFTDKQSGKDFDRPAYRRLLHVLREGDILVVKSIDRLGRDYEEIIEQWRCITKEIKADIKVIDMPLLDTTLSKDLLGTFFCRRKRAGKHPAAAARRYRSRPGARRAFWQTLCRDQPGGYRCDSAI